MNITIEIKYCALIWNLKLIITKMHGQQHIKRLGNYMMGGRISWDQATCWLVGYYWSIGAISCLLPPVLLSWIQKQYLPQFNVSTAYQTARCHNTAGHSYEFYNPAHSRRSL